MSARAHLRWQFVRTLAARGLTGTATVMLTYFVSRQFGVENAGLVNLTWLLLLLVAMFARYGGDYAGVKYLAVHASRHDAVGATAFVGASAGVFLLLLACALPVALGVGSRLFIPYGAQLPDLLLFGLTLCVFGALSFLAPLHRGLSRPDASYCFDQGGIAILLLFMLAATAHAESFTTDFLLALLTAAVIVLVLSFGYFRRTFHMQFTRPLKIAPTVTVAALKDGLPYFIICIAEYFLFWTGLLLLGVLELQTSAGIYAVLLRTAQLAVVAMGIINAIVSPKLAALQSARRARRLRHYVGRIWKLNFTLGAIALLAIYLLLPIALASAAIAADPGIHLAFLLLMLPQVLKILIGPVSQIMAMSGAGQHKLACVAVASLLFAVALTLVLVPAYDFVGAATGYCAGLSAYHLLCLFSIRSSHGFYTFEAGPRVLRKWLRTRGR